MRELVVCCAFLKSPVPSEDHEQMLFVQWFRRTHPGVLIFAIPNGGHRHMAVASRMKSTGTVPGIPDLFIPAWRLWIEMKRQTGGRLSQAQKAMIEYLGTCGYSVIVAHGADDAIKETLLFKKHLMPG